MKTNRKKCAPRAPARPLLRLHSVDEIRAAKAAFDRTAAALSQSLKTGTTAEARAAQQAFFRAFDAYEKMW